MMRYALALVCACVLALTPFALADQGNPSEAATSSPTTGSCSQTYEAARQSAAQALAPKRWRRQHPLAGVDLRAQCLPLDVQRDLKAFVQSKRAAFFRYADRQFRACAPTDCQRWAARFVSGVQMRCLRALWSRESGWVRTRANYGGSGAYGIPQALPGSKMGDGWQTDGKVQIHWGLGYIHGTYGTPCSADGFQAAHNWY